MFNSAVKIITLILDEEATRSGTHALNGAQYLEKMSNRSKQAVIKAYMKLFERDLVSDMAEALCAGDDYYEELEKNK